MRILAIVLFVLGLLLAVAVWILGPSYGLESWIARLAIGLALVLPVPLVALFRALAARKKARAGLSPKAAAATLATVRDRLLKLRKVLDASKVSGQDLTLLPWAVLVGPRASGKTGSILRSRMEIPFTTAKPDAPSDFEAHLSRAGVVIDFGGRFFSGPGTPDLVDFGGAIEAVTKAHPRQRIDAVVLALDLGTVLEGSADQLERMATDGRAVLETLREASGYSPPVYVVFEKADRVPGLAEAYGVLPSAERGQALGAQLEGPESIRPRLAALVSRCRGLGLQRLGQLESPLRFATVTAHLELEAVTERVAPLVEKLFLPSSLGEPARIAGVYFASTEVDGRTTSLVDGQLGLATLPPPPPDPGPKPVARSYFAFELWAKVVLGAALASVERSAVGRRRRRAEALTWLGGAAVVGGLWAILATISFFSNQGLLSRAEAAVTQAAPPKSDEPAEIERHLGGLAALAGEVRQLAEWDRAGAPLGHRAFLYQGDRLLRPLTAVLDEHMRVAFVEPASTEIETALLDAKGSDDVSRDYDLLKAYLMVTEARPRLDVDQAARTWLAAWQTQLHPQVAQNQALLEPLVRSHLELVQRGLVKWRPTNAEAIQIARKSAIARGAEYQRMVADAARDTPALTLSAMLGNRYADVMTSNEEIRGLYTVQGWRKVRGPLGETPEGVSAWVLEQFPSDDELVASLEQEYMAAFRSEWTRFLGGITLIKATNVTEAGKLLEGLTAGDPIYHALVRRMKQEMAFPSAEDEARAAVMKAGSKNALVKTADKYDDKVLPKRAPNGVQEFFQPLLDSIDPPPGADGAKPPEPLVQYTAKLAELATAIQAFATDAKADVSALEPTVAEARARANDLLRRFEGKDRLRAVLEPLFLDPLSGALARAEDERAQRRAGTFAASVCEPFYESLGGKYPFALRKEEVLLDDVVAFFGPQGAVKTFYDSTLSKDLVAQGDDYVVEPGRTVDPEIVEFYRVAMKVAQVFFPGQATELSREFQVVPEQVILPPKDAPKVSGFVLEVGEVKQTYEFGAERTWTFAWPTKIGKARLALLGRGDLSAIEVSGDWAWFRLIDRASKAEALEGGWHRVSWFLDGVEVRVRVRTSGRMNPLFEHRLYSRLECTRR